MISTAIRRANTVKPNLLPMISLDYRCTCTPYNVETTWIFIWTPQLRNSIPIYSNDLCRKVYAVNFSRCSENLNVLPKIILLKRALFFQSNTATIELTGEQQLSLLTIRNVNRETMGRFVCMAKNDKGESQSNPVLLDVQCK